MVIRFLLLMFLALPTVARAGEPHAPGTMCSPGSFGHMQCIRPAHFVHDTCQALEIFAKTHGLDPGFFARLIWQESVFNPNALSHANARGIAQFIPSTAKLRGLRDSYNPAEALEYSAQYLGELTRHYGNQGLAAVAYNGGEGRADGLVARRAGLARETINYVQIITGLSAERWRDNPPQNHNFALQKGKSFQEGCHDLARNRKLTRLRKPAPSIKKWGIQLAFGTTRNRAMAQYRQRTRACSGLLRGERPDLVWQKSRASPRGGYFMARVGRNSRDSAWRLCSRLKARGCLCVVYKNR